MTRTVLLAAVAVFGLAGAAAAQDALTAAPTNYKKVFENDRLRVLELNAKPGAKIGMHNHPDHLFYMLTDGSLTFKPAGKTPYEMTLNAGESAWLPAQTRAAENDSDKPVRALIVELKQGTRVAAAASRSARSGKRAVQKGKRGKRRR